ncbi:MAG: radical SAM protein [Spirochaetia bacterium]|nr:radical SAM protein [Spirochaetia bacterium]
MTIINSAIRLLQKNKLLARFVEDMYSRVPYYMMNGKALPPLSVVLLLTYRCNLRCKMCFYYNEAEKSNTQSLIHSRNSEELTREQINSLIDQAVTMKARVLTLHGGEPLIYEDVFDIAKYAVSKGLLVNFITNGVLLTQPVVDRIIDAGINSITISLDGPERIHDDVRGMKGAFAKIFDGISLFRQKEKEGKKMPKLSISTYVSAMNQDAFLELFEKVRETGITDWNIGLVTYNSEKSSVETRKILGGSVNGGHGNLSSLPEEIIALDKDKMIEAMLELRKRNSSAGLQITFPSRKAIERYSDPLFNEVDYCLYPWARIVISPYGEVFPCIPVSMVNYDMGNVKQDSLKDIWNGKKYVEFRRKLKKYKLLPICSKCCTINNIKLL